MQRKIIHLFFLTLLFSIILFGPNTVNAETDLIAHWNFDENSGTTLSDTIGGMNGTVTGATWTDGFRGNALSFDGVDDYVLTENVPMLNAYTISFIAKSGGYNPVADLYPRIINTPANRADIVIINNDKVYYNIKGDGFHDSSCTASTDAWSFITFTYDGLNRKFYQNGVLKHTKNVSGAGLVGPNSRSLGLSFGRNSSYGNNDSYAKVYLDDVKLYDGVLSDSEILVEYENRECTQDVWTCDDWKECQSNSQQTRSCVITKECSFVNTLSPDITQSCTFIPPVCNDWEYSDWSDCSTVGEQTRTIINSSPDSCAGGNPILNQSCDYFPICTASDWSCDNWENCSSSGEQTRICNKTSDCQNGISSPETTKSCNYTPECTSNSWSCDNWSKCFSNNTQTRTCDKVSNCEGGESSPKTTKSCTYTPPCSADTWTCNNWNTCSPQGIQSRSCKKTFNCSFVQTAPPATSQYCEAPNRPEYKTPSDDLDIVNQNSIIKATVKLICPVSRTMASQGSGTVVNSNGTILTNRHVIEGTVGCLVGFIDDYDDEPYFGNRQIADIYKVSSNNDVAILKLRNPSKKKLTSIDISKGNSNDLSLGEQLTTYGYPAKFGTKITYTSGDFSGVYGNYLKTTAIIESGNSGGGAYLKNGTFIGMPTAVVEGNLNSIGHVLSINTINSWLNNSPIAYNNNNNNNYSRVSSLLEDIDLDTLNSLDLFIFDEDAVEQNTDVQKETAPIPKQNVPTNNFDEEDNKIEKVEESPSIVIISDEDTQSEEATTTNSGETKEGVGLIQKIIQAIKDLFKNLFNW